MQSLSITQTKNLLLYVAQNMIAQKDYLGEIDGKIGDGDHGIGMAIGFKTVKETLEQSQYETINDLFKDTGLAMLKSMGGASGVIFGSLFVSGIKHLEPKTELDLETWTTIFENALVEIKRRGKASVGDKTMVDALEPAVEGLKEGLRQELSLYDAINLAVQKAHDGVEATKQYVAKFGRARSLGERAVGHQDAGATSVWLIFLYCQQFIEKELQVGHHG